MQSLGSPILGLVFDTGLSVTPLMGHLGCLSGHWSVPVVWPWHVLAISKADPTIVIE